MVITTLAEDRAHYLENWKNNLDVSPTKKKIWTQDRKLTKAQLGYDHENPLKLLSAEGYHGEPSVGSVTTGTARASFWNEGHTFPPDGDIIRFGLFFNVGFYKSLIMVIKNRWEAYLRVIKDVNVADFKDEEVIEEYIKIFSIKDIDDVVEQLDKLKFNDDKLKFNDIEELYELFEEHWNYASNAGYDDEDKFKSVINQIIKEHLHLPSIRSQETEKFIERQKKIMESLKDGDTSDSIKFWEKKIEWLELENKVGDRLLELEDVRLRNANDNNKWMAIFGKAYIPRMEIENKVKMLKRKIQLKEESPELSIENIDEQTLQDENKQREDIEKLKRDVTTSNRLINRGSNGTACGGEELKQYKNKCKRLLRKIWKFTYEDVINNSNFTSYQKKKLREYFDRAISIRDSEIGLDIRSVPELECIVAELRDILEEVNVIRNYEGIDVNPEMVIVGNTIQEQIAWLEQRIAKLEDEIKQIVVDKKVLEDDEDIKEKRSSMSSEEQIADILKQMEEQTREYEKEYKVLNRRLEKLFKDNKSGKNGNGKTKKQEGG